MSIPTQNLKIKELSIDKIPPSTSNYTESSQGGSKIVVIGKPGCFTKGTGILMYDGTIKNVENVNVGDKIMGDDSTVRNVMETCHNYDEMFEIIPNKGEKYTVNKQHKLVLKSSGFNRYKKGEIIEITVENYLKESLTFKNRMKIFRTAVDFPTQKVNIDPYLLGVWLGDGTSATSEFTNTDEEILTFLQQYSDDNDMVFAKKSKSSKCEYRISSNEGTKGKNELINSLRDYNLLKNKHIPQVYKSNSREVRLQLLAGLLDTDGFYDNTGMGYDFIQKNETLFNDVLFIARSLGFSANKKEVRKSCLYKNQKSEGTYFRCFISGKTIDEIPCKIKRKIPGKRTCTKDNLVSGFKLDSKGDGEYWGFTLDGNHRFLLGSCDVVRNTGKTTLISSLLYEKSHIFPVGVVMSGTEDSNGHYRKMFPSTFVYNKLEEPKIEDFVKRQKIAKKHLKNPWAVLLLDDCTDDPKIFNKPLFQGLYKNGRHWKCWYILSLQYCMDIKPVIRTNIDGTFILRETNLKNRKALWENYAGVIPDFSMFCDIMDQLTDDYTALYIHNTTQSNNIEDCVFYYKARPIPRDFKFGSTEFWDFHNARYNPEYIDPVI